MDGRQVITEEEARDRVADGAEWLDSEEPDWLERMDTTALNVGSTYECPWAQVYGHEEAFDRFTCPSPTYKWDVDHGFQLGMYEAYAGDGSADLSGYDILTEAWRNLIEGRRT